jgi:oxepin-CoA hydrolase/3-oxo-5,6-dehydrosuberyl-CoA semialdehyde dehydrogenase
VTFPINQLTHTIMDILNYACGEWIKGAGKGVPLVDSVTGEEFARAGTEGLDFAAMLRYGRDTGGRVLRAMTFQQRGNLLKSLALHLQKHKDRFYELSYRSGATRVDSWIDIEGGFGNLFANASLRKLFPNQPYDVEGDAIDLSRGGRFMAHHLLVPKPGVAVHINAFNFPIWGMLEKCAVNWMAGVPAIVKPATATCYLTEAVVREIIASGILPEGALQLICGSSGDLLDHLESHDVVTFTGSAATGRLLKAHPRIIHEAVPFNMEADSLNCSVLGPDAAPGTPEFDLFISQARTEITVKCGQKCTAIRRIIVPEAWIDEVRQALSKALDKVTIGDPRLKEVRMGTLVSRAQVEEVRECVNQIAATAKIVYGGLDAPEVIGADAAKGAFIRPVILLEEKPFQHPQAHDIEAFGPVSTLMPYKDLGEAVELARLGKGSLVSSIVTHDDAVAKEYVVNAATHHGRILVLNRENAKQSTGHGSPMPMLVHGGPGRAGGGEEMGGTRGIRHYMQRCAVQGTPTTLTAITGIHQPRSAPKASAVHPFRLHWDELEPGMSIETHKRTVTDTDIINFSNLTWDHFYAHTDITSLEGSIFEKRAAHGYFILSAAAGLFVHPNKGPVVANYGLEDCRFLRPIYHNDTIYVRLTCKQKIERDSPPTEVPCGIVKWYVEVFDQSDDLVAMATILTMVRKKSPFAEVHAGNIGAILGKISSQETLERIEAGLRQAIDGNGSVDGPADDAEAAKRKQAIYHYDPLPESLDWPTIGASAHADRTTALTKTLEAHAAYEAHFRANPGARTHHPHFGAMDKFEWDLLHTKLLARIAATA